MIIFFSVATVLLLGALALVVYPLVRGRDSGTEDHRGDVVALSRERLAELKRRKETGEVDEDEYAEQVSDLEAQLADDLHSQTSPASKSARGGQWIGFAVMIFVPVLSGLLYLAIGTPQALVTDTRSGATQAGADGEHPTDVQTMVSRLAERLEKNPDDAEGWFMLGRSYMVLNRYQQAAEAFGRLRELVGDRPEVLLREASALALGQGGALAGKPSQLVEQALQQQPEHPQALWMAATAAYQSADYRTALDYYRRVEPKLQGENLQQVRGMIDELVAKGYGEAEARAGGETGTQADATTDTRTNAAGPSLVVNVTLAPSLEPSADGRDSDTVFIFAKAANGPPMPLAVVRKTVADLPVTVTLDESQAMMPQMTLASFDRVTVGARISSSGQPTAQPGDLEGESEPIPTATAKTVNVTIDRIVPETQ